MKTKYHISIAHSGTAESEIAKAKRHYRKHGKLGEEVQIQFFDINCEIIAKFVDRNGQELCEPCQIN